MKQVPFNDLGRQYRALKSKIDQTVSSVLASGWYLLGEQTRAFEGFVAERRPL